MCVCVCVYIEQNRLEKNVWVLLKRNPTSSPHIPGMNSIFFKLFHKGLSSHFKIQKLSIRKTVFIPRFILWNNHKATFQLDTVIVKLPQKKFSVTLIWQLNLQDSVWNPCWPKSLWLIPGIIQEKIKHITPSYFPFRNTRVKSCKDSIKQWCPSGDKFSKDVLTRKIFLWQDV